MLYATATLQILQPTRRASHAVPLVSKSEADSARGGAARVASWAGPGRGRAATGRGRRKGGNHWGINIDRGLRRENGRVLGDPSRTRLRHRLNHLYRQTGLNSLIHRLFLRCAGYGDRGGKGTKHADKHADTHTDNHCVLALLYVSHSPSRTFTQGYF